MPWRIAVSGSQLVRLGSLVMGDDGFRFWEQRRHRMHGMLAKMGLPNRLEVADSSAIGTNRLAVDVSRSNPTKKAVPYPGYVPAPLYPEGPAPLLSYGRDWMDT